MGQIILYLILGVTALGCLFQPWIGVIAYYTLAILTPQAIWFWVFGDMRVSYYVSLAAIAGFFVAVFLRKIDFSILKDRQNIYIGVLWLSLNISYYFSPYGTNKEGGLALNSEYLINLCNKIFLFYFISVLLINTPKKIHFVVLVIAIATIYHTYWANDRYLSGLMYGPRLQGPDGVYTDENAYALLFVTGIPFLYSLGSYYSNKILKYTLWGIIPFAWHAIFLTASRGGLLGMAIVTIVIGVRSKSKVIGLAVLLALIAAFVWQAGSVMKERSSTIVEADEDGSVQGRYDAWEAATQMVKKYPVTGVGIGNFVKAFPDFSEKYPRVAHNTFFQLAAESGILAGVAYLLLCWEILRHFFKRRYFKWKELDPLLQSCHDTVTTATAGFFVCSMFLNLATYEIFYYLLVLNLVIRKIVYKQEILHNLYLLQQLKLREHPVPVS